MSNRLGRTTLPRPSQAIRQRARIIQERHLHQSIHSSHCPLRNTNRLHSTNPTLHSHLLARQRPSSTLRLVGLRPRRFRTNTASSDQISRGEQHCNVNGRPRIGLLAISCIFRPLLRFLRTRLRIHHYLSGMGEVSPYCASPRET